MAGKNFKKALETKKSLAPARVAIPQIDPSGADTPQSTSVQKPAKDKAQKETIKVPSPAPVKKAVSKDDEVFRNYATYISDRQKKQIKLRAIEEECNDQTIVQRALEEYFKNHPL